MESVAYISIWIAGDWQDYALLDAGYGEKIERWGPFVLRRPDPQAVWPADKDAGHWLDADAFYHRSASGGGAWEFSRALPEKWAISYKRLRFNVKPMQFKHTGLFPEQAVNWDWIVDRLGSRRWRDGDKRVLNLFAYTGAATMAAASAGACVCHVDAARGMVQAAKENAGLSNIPHEKTRYIVDDVFKFVRREIRRGAEYDAIIMDPPAYGRGPGGELWKAEDHLSDIVELCAQLLSDDPLFFVINSYTTGTSATSIENILKVVVAGRFGGAAESGELGIPAMRGGIVLPCGCCARWERS